MMMDTIMRVMMDDARFFSYFAEDLKKSLSKVKNDIESSERGYVLQKLELENLMKALSAYDDRSGTMEKPAQDSFSQQIEKLRDLSTAQLKLLQERWDHILNNIPVKEIVFKDGMDVRRKGESDTTMTKSAQLENLMADLMSIPLPFSSKAVEWSETIGIFHTIVQDAVNSECFSDEKEILMAFLEDIKKLQISDITRTTFKELLAKHMNCLADKLKELEEAEKKEAFKEKILQNIDSLYEVYKNIKG